MNKNIKQPRIKVIGIETRTNNAKEMGQEGVIPKQWSIFIEQNLLEKIPNKVSSGIIAGYTEYQSNKDGEYTFFIGAQVSSNESVPEGMVVKVIPEGNYAVLTSEIGPVWEVVQALWKKIWTAPTPEIWSELNRSYQFDYEVYDERVKDPTNAQVDVFLGIR